MSAAERDGGEMETTICRLIKLVLSQLYVKLQGLWASLQTHPIGLVSVFSRHHSHHLLSIGLIWTNIYSHGHFF
jgi:hypothetical protein